MIRAPVLVGVHTAMQRTLDTIVALGALDDRFCAALRTKLPTPIWLLQVCLVYDVAVQTDLRYIESDCS
jgi:hypothetical protein